MKDKFRYFEQDELDPNETYLMYRDKSLMSTKLEGNRDGVLYTTFGGLKANTALLRPFSEVKDTVVMWGNYRGLLKGLLPVDTTEAVKWGGTLKYYPSYENYYFARVYWLEGQKMIPHSFVKLNQLKFTGDDKK